MKALKRHGADFLMMFLAVTLGFFAENIRENFAMRSKEREFVISLIKDLENDTLMIHKSLPRKKQIVSGLDSLIIETNRFVKGKGDTRRMYYYYHHYSRNFEPMRISFQTINQLKNAVYVDVIQNNKVNLIIDEYSEFQTEVRKYEDRAFDLSQRANAFGLKIFDFEVYQQVNIDIKGVFDPSEDGFLKLSSEPKLITNDPYLLKQFAGYIGYYRNNYQSNMVNLYESVLSAMENSIKVLVHEYEIDTQTLQKINLEVKDNK